MILDNSLIFDNAAAVTATRVSTNIIDLGVQQDIGVGEPLSLFAIPTGVWAGGTSLNIQVQGAQNNAGSPGTFVTLAETGVMSLAQIQASQNVQDFNLLGFTMPKRAGGALPRFLQLNYVVVGPFTGGTITSGISHGTDELPQYPSGITINN